jgi:hypothetical protein
LCRGRGWWRGCCRSTQKGERGRPPIGLERMLRIYFLQQWYGLAPRLRVVSREISEEFGERLVVEAAQAGVVVIGDEGVEVGIAFGMVAKAAMGAQLRSAVEMLAEVAVEALDHAVIEHDDFGALVSAASLRKRVMVSPSGTRSAGSTKVRARRRQTLAESPSSYMAAPCDQPGCAASADQ